MISLFHTKDFEVTPKKSPSFESPNTGGEKIAIVRNITMKNKKLHGATLSENLEFSGRLLLGG